MILLPAHGLTGWSLRFESIKNNSHDLSSLKTYPHFLRFQNTPPRNETYVSYSRKRKTDGIGVVPSGPAAGINRLEKNREKGSDRVPDPGASTHTRIDNPVCKILVRSSRLFCISSCRTITDGLPPRTQTGRRVGRHSKTSASITVKVERKV